MTISIRWVNHAAFVLEYENIHLLTDPWLFGSAFNNGWDLLCKTHFEVDDFTKITHIWFSHEHPDHFSPPVLKAVPEVIRSKITVLFQETNDKKVISYCLGLGFSVQELKNHEWHELSPRCRLMCGKVPFFDSWLLIETEEAKLLNANDCVVDGDGIATEIAGHTGTVDLLFTQFSYASWEGNPDETERRRASAAEKLDRVKLQIETFQPTYTIPFASFIYFSHEENFFCNEGANSIRDAHEFIQEETASRSVILYPEERWTVGEPHDNEVSLSLYDLDYNLEQKPLHQSESVPFEQLALLARDYRERMTMQNSRLLIWLMASPPLNYFEPVHFYLTDLKTSVLFSIQSGLQKASGHDSEADVRLSSESLAYIFQYDWGFDTLTINGRFQATQANYKRMMKAFFLGPLNNTGRYLRFKTMFELDFVRRALSKLRSLG